MSRGDWIPKPRRRINRLYRSGPSAQRQLSSLTLPIKSRLTQLFVPTAELHARLPSIILLVLRIGLLLTVYVVLDRVLVKVTNLPAASYEQPFILPQLIKHLLTSKAGLLASAGLLIFVLAMLVRNRTVNPAWQSIEEGKKLRHIVLLVAFILAWAYGTYDYNLFFDQRHDLDRLFLFALIPLTYWRPIFVFPFLLVILTILHQFNIPIGGYSWAEQILLVRILILFGAFLLIASLSNFRNVTDFVFLLFCLIAGHYWVCGLGKLQLDWMALDRIHYLLPATYANGWLGFLDPDEISRLTRTFSWFNEPLKAATLVIECGALVSLWRMIWLRVFLLACIALHVGIVVLTGIFFWKWVVLDAALAILLMKNKMPATGFFTANHFVLSVLIIGGSALWFKPTELAWLDARISYTYRFEALGTNGRTYTLPPRFFAPYDYQFTLSNFSYLTKEPHLGIVWGATMRRFIVERLEEKTTPNEVFEFEKNVDHRTYSDRRSAIFDDFLLRIIDNWNRHGKVEGWWSFIQAPRQLWTFGSGQRIPDSQRIKKITVYQVTSLFDGRQYQEIRTRPVRSVDVELSRGDVTLRSSTD